MRCFERTEFLSTHDSQSTRMHPTDQHELTQLRRSVFSQGISRVPPNDINRLYGKHARKNETG